MGEGHARAALQLAEDLDDDALRVGALSILARLRFDLGDAAAPALAERAYGLASASGDREQLADASGTLGHILVWSVSTDRARALLESLYEEECDRDERAGAESLFYLAFVELRAGRWAGRLGVRRTGVSTSVVNTGHPGPTPSFPLR